MADKVKPLKIETAIDGTQTDMFPTETNPAQDYLAAKGVAFENSDSRLIDLDGSGNIQFKDATETSYWPLWKLKKALYNVFNPTGTSLSSTDTESAIKELFNLLGATSRSFVFAQYNGNANTGRYLEFFSGIDSNTAPLYTTVDLKILTIVAGSTGSSTGVISFYDDTTLLHSTTFTATTQVTEIGTVATPIFTLPAGGYLKIKVSSGSITKPHLYFVAQGG